MDLLKFVIGALAVLFALWFAAGGPSSPRVNDPFINPPPPVGTGGTYSLGQGGKGATTQAPKTTTQTQTQTSIKPRDTSIFEEKISFYVRGSARLTDPDREYLEIRAALNNATPVNVSGWTLKSAATGKSVSIGNGVYLPIGGRVNEEKPIVLAPGERAFLITGRSPKGYSFRLNVCTGYFEQFQDFIPSLPKECPLPKDENLPTGPNGMTDMCLNYIESVRRCEAQTNPLPLSFANDPICQEYVAKEINYNACVDTHKNDAGFYKPEWRVFFGRDQELWKAERETILLLDENGKQVDSVSY